MSDRYIGNELTVNVFFYQKNAMERKRILFALEPVITQMTQMH